MAACPVLVKLTILYALVMLESSSAFGVAPLHFASSSSVASKTRLQMSTADTIQEEQVDLPSGASMQILSSQPQKADPKLPPILFLHGSFHGAWCWSEKYFPYFTSLGYPVVALSWRGTEKTFAGEGVKKVKISEHVADLNAVLEEYLPNKFKGLPLNKPILVSHSFGGLSIMKYLEEFPEKCKNLSGAVIACSVPPSGNGKMTMRFLRRSLRDSWKVTKGLAMKKVINDAPLCRELFFGGVEDYHEVSDEDVTRYQGHFERDTVATIDLLDLAKKLPSAATDDSGVALFMNQAQMPPFLVIGATEDFIVDREGINETATYFGLDRPVIVDSPHDIMLGRKWKNAADEIHNWVQNVVLKQ